jgi:hypothetical protein
LDVGVRDAVLTALKGVIKHAGKSVSGAIRLRSCLLLRDILVLEDDDARFSAAKVIGLLSQVQPLPHPQGKKWKKNNKAKLGKAPD